MIKNAHLCNCFPILQPEVPGKLLKVIHNLYCLNLNQPMVLLVIPDPQLLSMGPLTTLRPKLNVLNRKDFL